MAEDRAYPFYSGILAFLRTRLLGAVLMPALIGAGFAARVGEFQLFRFVLILIGLAAAELLNLLGADFQQSRQSNNGEIQLPGNPVFDPEAVPASRLPLLLVPIAAVGLGVLIYFTITVGAGVLLFLLAAAVIGALYVFSPFRYAFLYTAFIPPLISGGVYLAMSGEMEGAAFAAGVPVTLISLAVILAYRVMYQQEGRDRLRTRAVVLATYCLAGICVMLYIPAGIFPWAAAAALAPIGVLTAMVAGVSRRERSDPVPATALGVMMHTGTCLAIAAALWLG